MVRSTPRPHFTPVKDPVPIIQEAGWATGPVCTGGKFRPHRDSIPDHPARSQSLYRLSYLAHQTKYLVNGNVYKVTIHTSGSVSTYRPSAKPGHPAQLLRGLQCNFHHGCPEMIVNLTHTLMCQVRDYDLESVNADILYNGIHTIKSKE